MQRYEMDEATSTNAAAPSGLGRRLGSLYAVIRQYLRSLGRQAPALEAPLPAAKLSDELAVQHVEVVAVLRSTCAISEGGVMVAGNALGALVDEAMAQGAEATALRKEAPPTLGADLKSFDGCVRSYLEELDGLAERVHTDATAAVVECKSIARAMTESRGVVLKSRYLATLMRTEVARLAHAEKVSFIADELNAFSQGVDELLKKVGNTTSNLLGDLESLQQSAAGLNRQREEDSILFTRSLSGVAASARAMEALVYGTTDATDNEQLATILRLSQEALSCFQYQDPMAQDLQTIDVLIAELRTVMNDDDVPVTVEPIAYAKRLGDDAAVDTSAAATGDVVLF